MLFRMLISFVFLFIPIIRVIGQEDVKMNIIVAHNNSLIRDGKISFVVNKRDTVSCKYYVGDVRVDQDDYEKLSYTENCDIIFSYVNVEREKQGKEIAHVLENKTYKIESVYNVSSSKVLILTIYENLKKKNNTEYECGYMANLFNLYQFNSRSPQSKRNRKKHTHFLKGFGIY